MTPRIIATAKRGKNDLPNIRAVDDKNPRVGRLMLRLFSTGSTDFLPCAVSGSSECPGLNWCRRPYCQASPRCWQHST
jgi:hypothetical protein